jgi:hypothetical protein
MDREIGSELRDSVVMPRHLFADLARMVAAAASAAAVTARRMREFANSHATAWNSAGG